MDLSKFFLLTSLAFFNIDVTTCDPVRTGKTLEKRIHFRQRRAIPAPPYPFTCPQATGYFQDIYKCTQFWKCIDGIPEIRKCPYLNRWSETKKNCDWRFRTPCVEADYTIPTTVASTTVESNDQSICTTDLQEKTVGCEIYVCWYGMWQLFSYVTSDECCALYNGC